jgi:FolB domain-containing protein
MDKVFIKDLIVRGVIGITEKERSQAQDIAINIVLFTNIEKGALSDNIDNCVNYRIVAKAIVSHIEKTARFTVEALANDIANICLQISGVKKVKVRIEKPGAVRFSKSVGVEIIRKNPL